MSIQESTEGDPCLTPLWILIIVETKSYGFGAVIVNASQWVS